LHLVFAFKKIRLMNGHSLF